MVYDVGRTEIELARNPANGTHVRAVDRAGHARAEAKNAQVETELGQEQRLHEHNLHGHRDLGRTKDPDGKRAVGASGCPALQTAFGAEDPQIGNTAPKCLFFLEISMLVHFGPFGFYLCKVGFEKQLFKIDYRPSTSYEMFKNTLGFFHGFGERSILSLYVLVH